MFDGIWRPFGVDPPFEAIARVRVDLERAARVGGAHRIEIGRFDKDIHRVHGTAAFRAAHHTRDAFDLFSVRNQGHAFAEGIFLVVQPHQGLAALGAVDAQAVARDLVRVEHVQRTVAVIGEEVRHIDEERDRAQANGAQLVLQPRRRRAVFDAADHTTVENRTLVQRVFVDRNRDRTRELPLDRGHIALFQRAQTTGRQITRDPAHTQGIGTVGGDRDLDHGVNLGGVVFRQPVDETVADIARGQLDDTVMFLG